MNILLIGSGGREHALAWKIKQSNHCDTLFCAPGNAGIAEITEIVDVSPDNHDDVIKFVQDNNIGLVVVGPEQPLVDGLGSALRKAGIKVFGPNVEAAALEGSKGFMKDFAKRHNIPTAAYARFTSIPDAKAYLETQSMPIVIKTDGLAAGKGVIIPETLDEANKVVDDMLSGNAFGGAGAEIIIEEFMDGEELSYFALSDGKSFVPLTSAQDHKRAYDGDKGPNTGGMGAYSPAHFIDDALEQKIMDEIIAPTVAGMAQDGSPFQGVLFAGLMVKDGQPKLIEYNIRFGDPECQAMMMRLDSDLVELLLATEEGTLDQYQGAIQWSEQPALCVVMAAKGYPGSYEKGTPIYGAEKLSELENAVLFHAGTMRDNSNILVSAGGRVLGVTATGHDIAQAQKNAYDAVSMIQWEEGFARSDIGWRAIAAKRKDQAA